MDFADPGTTEIAIALAGPLVLAAYVGLILVPAWTAYARWWERVAAGFLTLYILAAVLGIGIGIGLAIVWSYDKYA